VIFILIWQGALCCWKRCPPLNETHGSPVRTGTINQALPWGPRLEELAARKLKTAHLVTLQEMDARPLPARLRDGLARLLTPYL
jgi:hypothetical protein